MNSYIGLLNKLEQFCKQHPMIKRFGSDFYEQMSNISSESNKFPFVFVVPISKKLGEFSNVFTIDIYCWDLIREDRANINTCLSDTYLILTDIFIYLFNNDDYEINVIGFPTIYPLNNSLMDYAVGNVMRIEFEIDTYCSSDIPE
jgi:hypothetical protein